MNTSANSPSNTVPADEDLAEQAHPGHGIPSQDPDPAAQMPLEPEEAEREPKSVLIGGGLVAGAATGAAIGVVVAGPVGVLVGGTLGAVAGALGGAAAGTMMNPEDSSRADTSAPHHDSDTPSAPSVSDADKEAAGGAALIDAADAVALPTSFGVFKPVGHVVMGLPTQAQADALVAALHDAGWPGSAVRQFSPRESVAELRAMVDNAGTLAGFGYEITLLRRYLSLTEASYRWLLVKVDDNELAAAAAQVARACGATVAVHYRTLTVEELIP